MKRMHDCRKTTRQVTKRTIQYDTGWYFNVRSKANISQLNLAHETNKKDQKRKTKKYKRIGSL